MADWKKDKDRGPWPFTPQYNKWAYLNNPRWLDAPRQFVKGGPDDYDGFENREPQIWTPDQVPRSSNNFPKHHQCGHWHKPTGVSLPIPTGYPCSGNPQYIFHGGSIDVPGPDADPELGGLRSANAIGIYYDIDHTQLVPGTLITLPNSILGDGTEYWFWVRLPDDVLTRPIWIFDHYTQPDFPSGIVTEFWNNRSGVDGLPLDAIYHIVWASFDVKDVYFTGFAKWNDLKDGYLPALDVLAEYRFAFNPWLTNPYWALKGYIVESIGVYYGSPNTYGVGPYTLVPGTMVSTSSWDINIEPNLLPYPPTSDLADRYWLYLGIKFSHIAERVYVPYARVSESHPMQYFRWMGTIGGPDSFKVCIWIVNEVDSFLVCVPPVITFTAVPSSIDFGGSSVLTWSITGALSASIDNGIGEVDFESGTISVSPIENTVYILTATGLGGISTLSRTISLPAPTVTLSAVPDSISPGDSFTLSWISTNATSLVIDNGIGPVAASGSMVISPGASATYQITATGPGGSVNDSVTVLVSGSLAIWSYWKLDEISGNRLDSSGNGRTLSESGGVVDGDSNGAHFVDDHKELIRSGLDSFPNLDGTNYTLAIWIKGKKISDDLHSYYDGVFLWAPVNVDWYYNKGLGKWCLQVWDDDVFLDSADVLQSWNDDSEHLVIVYNDGSRTYVEVDNVPVMDDVGDGFSYDTSADGLELGGAWPAGIVEGWARFFGVWTQVLSPSDRTDIWNGGVPHSIY